MPVEIVRDTVGDGGKRGAQGHRITFQSLLNAKQLIVPIHDPNEHTYLAIAESGLAITRVFDRFPNRFQEEPFLRIHELRFARRNVEKKRIEFVHIPDKSAPFIVSSSRHSRL